MPEPRRRHRLGDKEGEQEDATQGKFPEGFSDETSDHVNTINISEALTLLREKLDDPDRASGAAAKDAANPVLSKTIEYLETFSRYKDLDTVKQLRNLLMEHSPEYAMEEEENGVTSGNLGLTGFERAQLANLAVETVEEAKNLVPTLETKDDAQLQTLIEELSTLRKFQA
ncbi:unnamed protein product [Parajaminaea phylloscopi]